MKFSRTVMAIDSHTMGEPTRIVIGGIPNVPGKTMAEKKSYLENNMDYIRTSLMCEPRGHRDMFGSILTNAITPDADYGIVFMDGGGYLNMCGHGSIGAVTAAIETGIIPITEPVTKVKFDAPAGVINARAQIENRVVQSVTIRNVPAFLYDPDVRIDVPGIGPIVMDISFGGSFFAIVDARQLSLKISPENSGRFIEAGMDILKAANAKLSIQHPELPHIKTIDLVEFYDAPEDPESDCKNVVIFGNGQADRSPCGTGTCAKMATLYTKNKLPLHQKFTQESIIGTKFTGMLLEETKVGDFDAVIPEITGSAYITGFNTFVIDPDDPLRFGFAI